MDVQSYKHEAERTLPPDHRLHLDKVAPGVVLEALSAFYVAAQRLDAIKKSYVYGRDMPGDYIYRDAAAASFSSNPIPEAVIHGVIGVATEAGETVEALVQAWFGLTTLDRVNVIEEGGDLLWYINRFLAGVDADLGTSMAANIAKLHKRHGVTEGVAHAFNRDAQTTAGRDLVGERVLMEETIRHGNVEQTNRIYGPDTVNLGLASNAELTAELDARESMGHTAPDYRTID